MNLGLFVCLFVLDLFCFVHVLLACMPVDPRSQKGVLNPLELELHMVVSHPVGAET